MKTRHWFENLAGCHAGQTGVVLATGPSLADLTEADLARLCHGRVVFAVKQALLRYPGANYHILNPVHLQPYRYEPRPTVFSSNWAANAPLPGVDYHFEKCGCGRKEHSLVVTRDWNRSLPAVQHCRQWGPGIMFELVAPLAIHFGIKRLIVVGWDLGPPGATTTEHALAVPNPIDLYPWEIAATIAAAGDYFRWLQGQGVALELLSRRSHLPADIPRIAYQEALP
jgi:hypothetical protein